MNILYICTHNRCRSVLSEAITNDISAKYPDVQLLAKSAGSQPVGQVHPLTIKYLDEADYKTAGLTSKSWDDLDGVFQPDLVVTVCDSANGESCPLWLGDTPKIHWGLTDPSKLAEDGQANEQTLQAFNQVIEIIEKRVEKLIEIAALPKEQWIKQIKKLSVD